MDHLKNNSLFIKEKKLSENSEPAQVAQVHLYCFQVALKGK